MYFPWPPLSMRPRSIHGLPMLRHTKILLWRLLALASLLLGLIGIVLPGLPTVPFLLLAAWAASRGWVRLERWLLAHPKLGPPIVQWRLHGALSRRTKWLASLMMAASVAMLWIISAPAWSKWIMPPFLLCVAIWLWLRPEPKYRSRGIECGAGRS